MSFILRYKKDIIDLINKKKSPETKLKNKNKINLKKMFLNKYEKNQFNILHIKDINDINIQENSTTKINNCPNINVPPLSSSKNKCNINKNIIKVDKKINTTNRMNKKTLPIFRLNYRVLKKNDNYNLFPNIQTRLSKSFNSVKRANNIEAENIMSKRAYYLLSNHFSKIKNINKIERITFYNNIQKAFENINDITRNISNSNNSVLIRSPIKRLYHKSKENS